MYNIYIIIVCGDSLAHRDRLQGRGRRGIGGGDRGQQLPPNSRKTNNNNNEDHTNIVTPMNTLIINS